MNRLQKASFTSDNTFEGALCMNFMFAETPGSMEENIFADYESPALELDRWV